MFNNHTLCSSTWCYTLQAREKKRKFKSASKYYNKTTDKDKYLAVRTALAKYSTKEILLESLHNYDTQMNECLNNVITKYAPKTKHYSGSASLVLRIAHAICNTNEGFKTYIIAIFNKLGIATNKELLRSLTRIVLVRDRNKLLKKKQFIKRKRKHGQEEKQQSQVLDEGMLTYGKSMRFSNK